MNKLAIIVTKQVHLWPFKATRTRIIFVNRLSLVKYGPGRLIKERLGWDNYSAAVVVDPIEFTKDIPAPTDKE